MVVAVVVTVSRIVLDSMLLDAADVLDELSAIFEEVRDDDGEDTVLVAVVVTVVRLVLEAGEL